MSVWSVVRVKTKRPRPGFEMGDLATNQILVQRLCGVDRYIRESVFKRAAYLGQSYGDCAQGAGAPKRPLSTFP